RFLRTYVREGEPRARRPSYWWPQPPRGGMVTGGVCGPAPRGPTGVAGGASVGLPPHIRDAVTGAWLAACAGPSPACPLAGFVATMTETVSMVALNGRSTGSGTWIGIATTGAGPCVASVGAGVATD